MNKRNKNACMFCRKSPYMYPGISLHSFPKDYKVRQLWLAACSIKEADLKPHRKLCSLHFEDNCFNFSSTRTFLKRGSIPTKFLRRTKTFFESGSFRNLSSADSILVRLYNQDASTYPLIKVSSSIVRGPEVSCLELFKTQMLKDPCAIILKRNQGKFHVFITKTADLSTLERAKFNFNNQVKNSLKLKKN